MKSKAKIPTGTTRRRSALALVERGLWSVALVAGGILAFVAVDRIRNERAMSSRLDELVRERAALTATVAPGTDPAAASAPARRPPPASGEPVGRLEIAAVGISEIVVAGTTPRILRRGVGHIEGTALPGGPGNVGLAGHRDTVFRGLRKLRLADRIVLVTADGSFEYEVESMLRVAPARGDLLDDLAHPTLTLVTCFPFDFVGPAPLRFVVRARELVERRAPARTAAGKPNRAVELAVGSEGSL